MEITHEEENFFRVSKLVYKELPAQLRSFFKDKWKCKYNLDWDDSPANGDTLWKKLSPGTRSRKWNDVIKNKIKGGSSHTWDCTVLFEVLLYLGLKLADANEREQIDCLREVRNKQCSHLADSQIPDNEKATIFTEVGEVYDELNWIKDKLRSIEQDVFITADLKEVKKKLEEEKRAALREDQQDFNNLPAKIKHFVGRENEIEEGMKNLRDNSLKKILLIHGGPCFGKSTLAITLGHKMVDKGLNFAIWISMRDISSQDGCPGMDKLAEKILREFEIDTSEMRDDIQSYLDKKLSMISTSGKKLVLIFDNADSLISDNDVFTQLKQLLANKKLKGDIQAMFTTRKNITTDEDYVHEIKLSCLSTDECKRYLDLALKSDTLVERETLINQLAAWSHGLPLALKILASEVNESEEKECLLEYLKDVEQDPAQTISENEEFQIFRLFEASFRGMDTGQLNLMKLLAVFPSSFSYGYMDNLSKCVKFKARLIQKLRRKGLVERQEPCYFIHPYLCEYVRQEKWSSGDKELYEKAYAEVYLKSLFELGSRSLERDASAESRSEFVNERHNFLHMMASIGEKNAAERSGTESLSFLDGILDRQTSEYVSVMIFVLGLVHPATLIDFYEDCERLVPEEMKPNIWSIRHELKMKCYDMELPKPEDYVIVDDCASVLIDSRALHDKVWEAEKSNKIVDGSKKNSLLEEVQELEKRASELKCPKMQAYFGRKVWKDTGILYKRRKNDKKAKEAYENSLKISQDKFGIGWLTFDCYQQLAMFYFKIKETENALRNFNKAEEVAEEMGGKKDKKFNAHLLNKGRFLVSTGTQENVIEGTELLKKALELLYHDSDSNYWAKAVDCLATVDPMYYDMVMPYLCTLECPRKPLLELVRTKFEYEITLLEDDFDEQKIQQKGLAAVNDLKKALEHVGLILEKNEVEKSRLQLQEFRSLWCKLLAFKTSHVLMLSERAQFAQHALDGWNEDNADDVKRERARLEDIIKEAKNIDPNQEELIRRQHFLFKMKRLMEKAGRSEEMKDRYLKLLQDTEGYQELWTRFAKPLLMHDSSCFELVLPYLQSQEILSVPLLKQVTYMFTSRIDSVKSQTDEDTVNQVSLQAINDLKSAIEHVMSVEQRTNDGDENNNKNNNLPLNLFHWNKLLATRTDHCLTNSERRPFATEALRIAATTSNIRVDDNLKKSLRFLKNWSTKDSTLDQLQVRKQFLIANTKALQNANMQDELELKYHEFLNDSKDYPNLQLQLIKFILQHKIVSQETYPEYLSILVHQVTEKRLTSGWDLQVIIDHLPTTLQHDNSLQCQREGLSLCRRLNSFLKDTRMEFSPHLQKKFGFQLLKMICVDTDDNLLDIRSRRRYANAALNLDNRLHFTTKEPSFTEYRQQIEDILTNI